MHGVHECCCHGPCMQGLTFSPDGTRMWVVSEPNEVAVYHADGCPK